MARLPSSFRAKNRTTRQFREQFAALSNDMQEAVRDACRLFDQNPAHRSLRLHRLKDTSKGQHLSDSYSVSPRMDCRAIYVVAEDGTNVWYWIGTHGAYDVFTGVKG
jgi:hypothetical protein